MTSPNVLDILLLFRTAVPISFFQEMCRRLNIGFGSGIYNLAVISWLIILQRLQAHKTLAAAVQSLCQGQALSLMSDCKRVRDGNISPQSRRFLSSAEGVA